MRHNDQSIAKENDAGERNFQPQRPPRKRRWLLTLLASTMVLCVVLASRQAPGTVAEQRARLPPAAECSDDPVAGRWKSHQFYAKRKRWTIFTLEIQRDGGPKSTKLVGRIINHGWDGDKDREQPGRCGPKQRTRKQISMTARGQVNNGEITFQGTSWKLDRHICGPRLKFRYYLDKFTGRIDPKRQEFQSVNNDGGPMVNHPTVFRRIACLSDPPPANLKIKKPALLPKNNSGCSFRPPFERP